jgi:ferric-dicitrate binding protein FerR (iron transport regulator)
METTNENIRQLLEMLDHPEAYTEQEIHDIINRDEDTRETYRLMVEAKRSSRNRQDETPVDVDDAWQRFAEQNKNQTSILNSQIKKVAASFIGLLIVSGIAFAAIHIVRHYVGGDMPTPPQETIVEANQQVALDDTVKVATTDTIAPKATMEPVVFDNVPLEEMLPKIAAHYEATVTFANDKARQLRFRFVWNPQQDIDQVVSDLNQFESLTVTLKGNQISVE